MHYFRHSTAEIEDVLPLVRYTLSSRPDRKLKKIRANVNGQKVNVNSLRLNTFRVHGTTCAKCGVEGSFFALEADKGNLRTSRETGTPIRFHLNLYGVTDEGKEVLMTMDHIVPKARGGANSMCNAQTLCEWCNNKKGSRFSGIIRH